VLVVAAFQTAVPAPPPGPSTVVCTLGGIEVLARTPGGTAVFGFMPVVPMTLISAALMFLVSRVTAKPGAATLARYF
jgi:1,6-anhydro-N-acetylmuramate kinase